MRVAKSLIAAMGLVGAFGVQAQEMPNNITVKIVNLTQGMYFTPRLLVAHTGDLDLFEPGTESSPQLQLVAEGGVIGTADDEVADDFGSLLESEAAADLNAWQQFGGPLPPATASGDYTFDTEGFPYLSMVSMLIPTNDAFVGLDSWKIPSEPGTYTIALNAYDSGTEANDELIANMAAPPIEDLQALLGEGGTGVTDTAEGMVHIHRNALGDNNGEGGVSDLDATVHRWLNPVARLIVTIPPAP